jgi:hypothetical protein
MCLSWTFTILLTAAVVWLLPVAQRAASKALQLPSLWQALWPVAAGIVISGIVWLRSIRKKRLPALSLPQGDLLYVFGSLYRLFLDFSTKRSRRIQRSMFSALKTLQNKRPELQAIRKLPFWLEKRLTNWQIASLIFVILIVFLFAWSCRL